MCSNAKQSQLDFVSSAKHFRSEMAATGSLEELHRLWQSTSFPYSLESSDPFAEAYKKEITDLYTALTGESYRATCELTSVLQKPEDFKIGYPWVSKNLRVVASEMGKAVHAMSVMHNHAEHARTFIEFGAGWGNLVVPLARAGKQVAAVDIDAGFLSRISEEASMHNASVECLHDDFVSVVPRLQGRRFDCVVFCSSFHHCLDFVHLLDLIKSDVLSPDGSIFFFAEPVYAQLAFPWGLRYDGESVWAITCNKWLELGFSEEFFRSLFPRAGLHLEEIPATPGLAGRAWVARKV